MVVGNVVLQVEFASVTAAPPDAGYAVVAEIDTEERGIIERLKINLMLFINPRLHQ